jgi:HK97 gp10 family phage protein
MPITIQITGQEAVIARLKAMGGGVRQSLRRAVIASAIDVQARSRQKLAGEVLNERTHHLHDSIHFETVQDDASGVVTRVGTDVAYAAFWEYGFSGTENVREHLRRTSVAFGRPITPVDVLVRAHSRQVDQAPRSFLRSALAELEPEIRARIEAAVHQAVKGS